VTVFKS